MKPETPAKVELYTEIDRLKADNAKLREMVKRLTWRRGISTNGIEIKVCKHCSHDWPEHFKQCIAAEELGALNKKPPCQHVWYQVGGLQQRTCEKCWTVEALEEDDRAVPMPPKSSRRVAMVDPTYLRLLRAEHQAAVALIEWFRDSHIRDAGLTWEQWEAGHRERLTTWEAAVKAVEEARK